MEVAAGTHMGNTGRWKPKIAPSTYSLRGKEDLDNESSILFQICLPENLYGSFF